MAVAVRDPGLAKFGMVAPGRGRKPTVIDETINEMGAARCTRHRPARRTGRVGLYLNPPDQAVVLCVDEKSQIQALDRTQPSLPMKRGRAGTMTHDYKRNGTTTLFASLDVIKALRSDTPMPFPALDRREHPSVPSAFARWSARRRLCAHRVGTRRGQRPSPRPSAGCGQRHGDPAHQHRRRSEILQPGLQHDLGGSGASWSLSTSATAHMARSRWRLANCWSSVGDWRGAGAPFVGHVIGRSFRMEATTSTSCERILPDSASLVGVEDQGRQSTREPAPFVSAKDRGSPGAPSPGRRVPRSELARGAVRSRPRVGVGP